MPVINGVECESICDWSGLGQAIAWVTRRRFPAGKCLNGDWAYFRPTPQDERPISIEENESARWQLFDSALAGKIELRGHPAWRIDLARGRPHISERDLGAIRTIPVERLHLVRRTGILDDNTIYSPETGKAAAWAYRFLEFFTRDLISAFPPADDQLVYLLEDLRPVDVPSPPNRFFPPDPHYVSVGYPRPVEDVDRGDAEEAPFAKAPAKAIGSFNRADGLLQEPKAALAGSVSRNRAAAPANGRDIEPGFLRPKDAAAYLGVSKQKLDLDRVKGSGPPYSKFGKGVFYKREDLDAFMADRSRNSTSEDP